MKKADSWRLVSLLCTGALALFMSGMTGAQTVSNEVVPDADAIKTRKEAVETDTSLSAEVKAQALEHYNRAAAELQKTEQKAAESSELKDYIASAPEQVSLLRERLAKPLTPAETPATSADITLDKLEELIAQRQADLRTARDALVEMEDAHRETLTGGEDFSNQLAVRESALRATVRELDALPPAGEPVALGEARKFHLAARRRFQEAEIAFMRMGLTNYELIVERSTLERDAAAADLKVLEAEVESLEKLLQQRRADEVRKAREQAETVQAMTASLPEAVASIAKANTELRVELEDVTLKENEVTERLRSIEQQYGTFETDLAATRERVEVTGSTKAVGRLLRRRLARLPSPREYRRVAQERRDEISRVTDRRIDIDEQRSELSELDPQVDSLLKLIGEELGTFEEDYVRAQARKLLSAQREILTELTQHYRRYGSQLVALDVRERQFVAAVEESGEFIKARLLRIPNLAPLSFRDLAGVPGGIEWLVSPQGWSRALEDATKAYLQRPAVSIIAVFALVVVFYLRSRAPHRLAALADKKKQIRTDSITYTLRASGYTLVAASAWPLFLVILGWHIRADPIGAQYSLGMGRGLLAAAIWLFLLSLLRWAYHPHGLVIRHFRRPKRVAEHLARELRWLIVVLVPSVYVAVATHRIGDLVYINALGRPALVVAMVALGVFFWRCYRRAGTLGTQISERETEGGATRTWIVCLLVGIPVALAVASVIGYQYTAVELARLLSVTLLYLIALFLLRDVLLHWFYISERRLRLEALIRQREEARAEREKGAGDESDFFDIEPPEMDYKSLGEQGRAIVRVTVLVAAILSLGVVWSELLPVFGFFTDITLPFTRVSVVDGVEKLVPVTSADLGIGLLILLGTVFAVKNLPGLLELTILRRTRIDAGGRYAIVSLCQYLIVIIGVIAGFSTIGLQWSKLQWLVAALGVGLGFGLQEIVANFISGIILLLERPIRIGDTVTVGDQGGVVSRIQIRATTIMTWEKKELLVPNKEFVTGRVLNWTRSDQLTRILMNIGIAYGADVRKAMKLVMEAAKDNEHVLDDPAPVVTFEAFGDNALSVFLRAFCDSLDYRLSTTTELHQTIYDKLNEAGIPIAFPQRDVHLDTTKPLEIKVLHEKRGHSTFSNVTD